MLVLSSSSRLPRPPRTRNRAASSPRSAATPFTSSGFSQGQRVGRHDRHARARDANCQISNDISRRRRVWSGTSFRRPTPHGQAPSPQRRVGFAGVRRRFDHPTLDRQRRRRGDASPRAERRVCRSEHSVCRGHVPDVRGSVCRGAPPCGHEAWIRRSFCSRCSPRRRSRRGRASGSSARTPRSSTTSTSRAAAIGSTTKGS